MNTKTLFAVISIVLISLLSGCATQGPLVAGVDAPSTFKNAEYYKTNLKDVIAKAESGDVASQYEVAFVIGLSDIKTSNYWMEKAAAQNYLSAVSTLGARRYKYSQWHYPRNDALAEKLSYLAYDIYLSKPEYEWSPYEKRKAADSLIGIADVNLSNKELAQNLLCKAQKIGTTDKYTLHVLNQNLQKIGRTCK